ncbi:hypothetical protein AAFF_G00189020 [Aldrovandia affinis]|uniref:Uncharacterized protein n=1 Tax=Aldrovandia affinis TaxID=143900 RepID=A0AAD7RJX2_9TELE|nr:hypothetical protein AAFF_G00189020 [Aldrovandia affinis]
MWPKSSSKKEWATVDADLIKILDGVKGTVEKKLEKIGDLIYVYGAESNIGLYGHGALELPVSSLTEEYKCTKVRLNMILTESQDGMISGCPRLATGRKWMPSEAVQQAKSALRHGDIVGQVQHGRDPATLRHILTGCKTSLSQGRYTWRHNQVLRQLAITLEGRRTTNNAPLPQCLDTQRPPFCKSRTTPSKAICKSGSNPPRHCPGLENAG